MRFIRRLSRAMQGMQGSSSPHVRYRVLSPIKQYATHEHKTLAKVIAGIVVVGGVTAADSSKVEAQEDGILMTGGHAEDFACAGEGLIWKTSNKVEADALQKLASDPQSTGLVPQVFEVKAAPKEGKWMVKMQNLTHGFVQPCVLDVKLGMRSYRLEGYPGSLGKKERLAARDASTTTLKIGMRMSGMHVVRDDGSIHEREAHNFGRILTPTTFVDEIVDFFCKGPERLHNPEERMAAEAHAQVNKIVQFFEKQDGMSFIGSSILFIREGDAATIRAGRARPPVVKMIDFAHTFDVHEKDIGYLTGAKNCAAILGALAGGPSALQDFRDRIDAGTAFATVSASDALNIKGYRGAELKQAQSQEALAAPHYDSAKQELAPALRAALAAEKQVADELKNQGARLK